ncbi:MAG: toxin-antitoxin system YwqK family antitoxin [Actinocrinis sp.]
MTEGYQSADKDFPDNDPDGHTETGDPVSTTDPQPAAQEPNASNASTLRVDIDSDDVDFDYNQCLYQGEPFTGELAEYSTDGALVALTPYVGGFINGTDRAYYADGTLKWEAQVRNGQPVGTSRSWHENGVLAEEKDFTENHRLVEVRAWDENGQPTEPATSW